MTAGGLGGVVDLEGGVGDPIRGAVKVAPAPINAASTGTTTAWAFADLARVWGLRRMRRYGVYMDIPKSPDRRGGNRWEEIVAEEIAAEGHKEIVAGEIAADGQEAGLQPVLSIEILEVPVHRR